MDQVRNGQALQVPSDGSNFRLQYSVEVDVSCSGPPNPNYYEYPGLAFLSTWSDIDINFWYLQGFAPAQTSPPQHIQYCPDAVTCPVTVGVASILNFVDFADFLDDTTTPFRAVPYRQALSEPYADCAPTAPGWTRKIFGQVFNQFVVAFTANGIPMTETVSIGARNDLGLSNPQIGTTTTALDQYADPPRTGAYDDWLYFCSVHCPGGGETDAIQTLTWNGKKVLHSNLLAYKCGGITVDGH